MNTSVLIKRHRPNENLKRYDEQLNYPNHCHLNSHGHLTQHINPARFFWKNYRQRYWSIIFTFCMVHLGLVTMLNTMQIPDTCKVAELSIEKLKVLNSVGRNVDFIIHDNEYTNSISFRNHIGNGGDRGDDDTQSASMDGTAEMDHDDHLHQHYKTERKTSFTNSNANNEDSEEKKSIQKEDRIMNVRGKTTTKVKVLTQQSLNEDGKHTNDNKNRSKNSIQHKFIPELPKIIHHQWKESSVPYRYLKWYKQWKIYFSESEYQHILWTDEMMRDLIKDHYGWFLDTYDNYDAPIKRADAARYFILHYFGGIYADLDYEPLVNFYEYLPQNQVGLVESPYVYNENTQNSFMTSPRGDPFWIDVFQGLTQSANKSVLHATGPKFIDKMVDSTEHPVYTLPCENFHRIPYGEWKESRWPAVFTREILTRIVPMKKHCGYFNEKESCQFGKHHNAATWTVDRFF